MFSVQWNQCVEALVFTFIEPIFDRLADLHNFSTNFSKFRSLIPLVICSKKRTLNILHSNHLQPYEKKKKSLYWNIVIIGSTVSRARVAVHANEASKRKSLLEFDCLHWIYTANNASVTGTTYVCVCWMTGNRALLLGCWKTFFATLWHLSSEGKDSARRKPSSALQPWPRYHPATLKHIVANGKMSDTSKQSRRVRPWRAYSSLLLFSLNCLRETLLSKLLMSGKTGIYYCRTE